MQEQFSTGQENLLMPGESSSAAPTHDPGIGALVSQPPLADSLLPNAMEPLSPPFEETPRYWTRRRLAGVAALGVVVGLLLYFSPQIAERFHLEAIRDLARSTGPFGILVLLGFYAARDLLRLPLVLLAAASVSVYGYTVGGLLAYFGVCLSVTLTFLVTRRFGPPEKVIRRGKWMNYLIQRVRHRPVITVFIARNLFPAATALSVLLALTSIRFRDYFVGNALGLIGPTFIALRLASWILGPI